MTAAKRRQFALRAVLWYTMCAYQMVRGSLLSGVPGSPVDQAETWRVSDAT